MPTHPRPISSVIPVQTGEPRRLPPPTSAVVQRRRPPLVAEGAGRAPAAPSGGMGAAGPPEKNLRGRAGGPNQRRKTGTSSPVEGRRVYTPAQAVGPALALSANRFTPPFFGPISLSATRCDSFRAPLARRSLSVADLSAPRGSNRRRKDDPKLHHPLRRRFDQTNPSCPHLRADYIGHFLCNGVCIVASCGCRTPKLDRATPGTGPPQKTRKTKRIESNTARARPPSSSPRPLSRPCLDVVPRPLSSGPNRACAGPLGCSRRPTLSRKGSWKPRRLLDSAAHTPLQSPRFRLTPRFSCPWTPALAVDVWL